MNFLRRFPLLAYTLVFLSLLAFNYAAENYGLLLFSLAAVLVSWWVVEVGNAPVVPRWVINTGVLIVALALFWELVIFQQNNMLLALGHFMVGLIICKVFEKKTNRDYGQILLLSLLLILSGAILTVSPIYALLLLIYLALGLYTSLVFNLQCETQRALLRHAAGDRMMIMPGQQTVMARDMRRISAGVGVFLFIFACGIFVIFPRSAMPGMLASWRIGATTVTGLTNHIQLGRFGQLQNSDATVAEVTIRQDGQNIGSQGYQPYFMSSTENFYDARTHEWLHARHSPWWPGGRGMRARQHSRREAGRKRKFRPHGWGSPEESLFPLTVPPPNDQRHFMRVRQFNGVVVLKRVGFTPLVPHIPYNAKGLITQRYTVRHARSGPLLAICPAVTISSPDLREVARRADGTIVAETMRGSLTYTVQSPLNYSSSLVGPNHPSLFPSMFRNSMYPEKIHSSPIPPRVAALARKIAGPLLKTKRTAANAEKIDMLLAERFCNYLKNTYSYSLDMTPVNPDIDPTEDFLLNKKKIGGYCEYFASAMVMFCRSVKIPARMVSGFHGGDYNPVGGYYLIEEKYAHAWVQAWIPQLGWVMFDPSPTSSLTSIQRKMTWFTEVADFFQWLRLKWLHNIITFNQSMRKAIINRIMTFARAVVQTIVHGVRVITRSVADFCRNWALNLWMKILMGIAALGLIPLGIMIYSRWKRRGSVATRAVRTMDRKVQRRMMRELMFIDRLMKLLNRTGIGREPDQTPHEYVQMVGGQTGLDMTEARRLVGIFYDIRFGSSRMSSQLAGVIDQDMAATEQKIRQRARRS